METDKGLKPKETRRYVGLWYTGERAPKWQPEFYRQAKDILQSDDFKQRGLELVIVPGQGQDVNSQKLEVRGEDQELADQLLEKISELWESHSSG